MNSIIMNFLINNDGHLLSSNKLFNVSIQMPSLGALNGIMTESVVHITATENKINAIMYS